MFKNCPDLKKEIITLLCDLCQIPAPSGHEEKRTAFITNWLCQECSLSSMQSPGTISSALDTSKAEPIQITVDAAKNVLVHIHPERPGSMPLFMAHTDTVFPDTEPLPCVLTDAEPFEKIYSPGAGDNTACVAILMLYLKYHKDWLLSLHHPVLFAFNSCEEGLGNLKGCRQIIKDYGHRISHVTSFDGGVNGICNHAIGSLRYKITVHTRGGHSFNDFGNCNAIQIMSELIRQLYQMPLPAVGKNTFNVGTISGGTSVNTIAQSCSCLFEYRSDTKENLEWMNRYFLETLEKLSMQNPKRPDTVLSLHKKECALHILRLRRDAQHHLQFRRSAIPRRAFLCNGNSRNFLLHKEKIPDFHLEFHLVGERPCMGNVDPLFQNQLTRLALDSIRNCFCDTAAPIVPEGHLPPIGAGSTDCNIPLSMGIPAICFGGLLGDGVHTREEYVTVSLLMREACIIEDYLQQLLA